MEIIIWLAVIVPKISGQPLFIGEVMNEKTDKVVNLGGNIKKGTVLFAANFQYKFREPAMAQALQSFGWTVENFSWRDYVPNSIDGFGT